jgi:hypothetical protein
MEIVVDANDASERNPKAKEAVGDWLYWVKMGYEF